MEAKNCTFQGNCEDGVNVGSGAILHLDACTSASNKEHNVRVDPGAVVWADKLQRI